MTSPDSVEKAGYLQHTIVRKMKPSAPGKDQAFRKTLKEKLEEDQEKKKKKRPEDEVLLEHDEQEQADDQSAPEQQTATEQADSDRADEGEESPPDANQSTEVTHIDVKA
jgi:hypothetical protein